MKNRIIALAISFMTVGVTLVSAATDAERLTDVLSSTVPAGVEVGKVKVQKVIVNKKARKVTVKCNESASYLPFTKESVSDLKSKMLKELGAEYQNYKIEVTANDFNIEDLALGSSRKYAGPKGESPFLTFEDRFTSVPTKGLEGTNIALWQSHGFYFENSLNRWEWQRARTMQTVEDLYTQSYVMPFLMPMLENAGAYVMSPRERDTNSVELIIDNDGALAVGTYTENGTGWKNSQNAGFAHKYKTYNDQQGRTNPFSLGSSRVVKADGKSIASWNVEIPETNLYAVYISYQSLINSSEKVTYTVNAADGPHKVTVNQKMGGGTWIYLGHYQLAKGVSEKPIVVLTATSGGKHNEVVTADAVKIGGGYGNIERPARYTNDLGEEKVEYVSSHYPRYTEGARYWLQWAGVPDSIYSPMKGVNDYTDDYSCRGKWVNWLAGGSSMLPDKDGLKIPVDLSFAFHSDAGTTYNDSIIGTLGIYSTDDGNKLGNGISRLVSRDLTDLVVTQIVNDVRASHEPNWTRRGLWDKKYRECREPQVPSMLLELLSHQNFADMKYGLDPEFRFTVSRAIYKAMLRFISLRDNREYVVQPLKVRSFEITKAGEHNYRLAWKPTEDKLEKTAVPTYYNIEIRTNYGPFVHFATTTSTEYEFSPISDDIYSFRVTAGNEGGVSFPSEILSLCDMSEENPVLIVNGFTRVSGPDNFESGNIAGFNDMRDHGVPYIKDINFIGSQFEFRRDIPWMDDDAAGFGASRANYEDKVIAGNTFDYVYTHGCAIKKAGRGFISSSVEAYMNSETEAMPQVLDLILGKQKEVKMGTGKYGTKFKTFPEALKSKISALCAAGGNVFVSGAFVASDLWDNSLSDAETLKADQKFATEVLGYHWRVDQASVTGEAFECPSRFHAFGRDNYDFYSELNDTSYVVESPDSFYPADKRGDTIIRYTENNLIAGVAVADNNYRTVIIGFPFESIKDSASRNALMAQILNFFSKK